MIHQRTHPNLDVEGCYACRISTIAFELPPSFSTKDPWAKNGKRAERIIKEREEAREGLTDLRYGRRVAAADERKVLSRRNHDGIKPRSWQ